MRPILIPPLLAICWGLNWPTIKIVLTAMPPFTLRWFGLGAGGLLLLLVAWVRRKPLLPGDRRGVLVGGLLNVAGFNLCTVFAQLNTTTSRAAVLTYTMPMISALLAWAWLGERPDRRRGLALALGGAGIALLAWPVAQLLAQGVDRRALIGLAMPIGAATAWAAGTVVAKRWPVAGDRIVNTGWQLLVGAAAGGVGAALTGESWPAELPAVVIAGLAYHVIVATSFAYVIWFLLLDRFSATVSSLTTLAVPVVGVLGAMLLVGERPVPLDWIGFGLVLGGAALAVLRLAR